MRALDEFQVPLKNKPYHPVYPDFLFCLENELCVSQKF